MSDETKYKKTTQLAKQWGVTLHTVLCLIATGQLRAVNVATDTAKRPSWRIPPDAVIEFEQRRAGGKKLAKPTRRGRSRTKTLTRHFD